MKRGFTLIELLVVVLIIGILSAVALPQYSKAVAKARAAEIPIIYKGIHEGYELCRLQHGYNDSADELCCAMDRGEFVGFEAPTPILSGSSCEDGGICFNTKYWQYATDDCESFYVRPLFHLEDVEIIGSISGSGEEINCYGSACPGIGFANCPNGIDSGCTLN